MTKPSCQQIFNDAKAERLNSRPFDRASAHKVRECHRTLERESEVVASIREYLAEPYDYYRSGCLVGCTPEDKAYRRKQVPGNIARQLGQDLIPAIEALTLEGIPALAVFAFANALAAPVQQLLKACDAIQTADSLSLNSAAAQLQACALVCDEALNIAEQAVKFCEQYAVLQALNHEVKANYRPTAPDGPLG